MLWLQNMKQVMGNSLWMWPFPFSQEMRGKGLFFPRIPEVSPSQARMLTTGDDHPAEQPSHRGHSRGYSGTDFESDPQEYINKAVKKYAGNTFFLPNQDDPDATDQDTKVASGDRQNTFFIPKNINREEAKIR